MRVVSIQRGICTREPVTGGSVGRVFTVLHVNGVHLVTVDYCDCEMRVPRRMQLLRAGWYPATIYYPATCAMIELLKHFYGLFLCSKTRYKVFLRMVQQFHYERMLKFLYTLFISVDANFWLKNHLHKNELLDPGLHTGLAYFVPQVPYTEHILKHISQTNISSCSGFAAMSQADSKSMQGLRYTGVRMCICAHHELVHLLGVGDLQKGEQMDYIVIFALTNLALHVLMIIYDISCQWGVNFHSQMSVLPSSLHISPTVQVTYAIPKCHLHAHQISCQSPNSLNLKPGVRQTDANSTKEMGAGSHHDTLDDLYGYHNWLKTTGLGLSLHCKYVLTVIEAKHHKGFHEELIMLIEIPGLVENWTTAIVAWENDKAQLNPYITTTSHALFITNESENDVKLQLMEMDKAEARAGGVQVHDKSATVFLSTGLSIEESQCCLRLQALEKELTSIQAGKLEEKRAALHHQIKHFCTIQRAYMPSLAIPLENSQCAEAEDMALHLPSSLDLHNHSGISTLAMKEEELQEAQCQDALKQIHLTQQAKHHLVTFKKKSQPGQRSEMCAHSSFNQLEAKLGQAVAKYCMAHAAFSNLQGPGKWITTLSILQNEDICPPPSFDIFDDTPRLEEAGVGDSADEELMARVRIEWAKSQILLCKEEM
ncbi:hypothetical protein BDN71DRAFT_1480284 [Pleurotus eryngii]|uniref:CxC2-like cysteine cluster KDZ transposase-associated domain-containing protein n=1 Tax=Pleurotus eryngii TaxID=5323 RepID=A0A9P6A9N5_PLEER|nr:hypothetical protein BDN71DRAFT_1480284 [Pleurotus eryngii]